MATFVDDTGEMELVWFRGHKWIKDSLKINEPYVVFGRCNWFNGVFSMPHPEMELMREHEQSLRTAMQPVYPSTEKLTNKGITNRVINQLMQELFNEPVYGFMSHCQNQLSRNYTLYQRQKPYLIFISLRVKNY